MDSSLSASRSRSECHSECPLVGGQALDMVSDGKTFKMLIPPKSCAIVGSDVVTNSSQKGLYSLRPAVILDSLLIHGMEPDQVVTMTQDSLVIENPRREGLHRGARLQHGVLLGARRARSPMPCVSFKSAAGSAAIPAGHLQRRGKVATQAFYSNYQKFGDVDFPHQDRDPAAAGRAGPDHHHHKATFNQNSSRRPVRPRPIPSNYAVQNMDDPASAATAPCVAHGPQSPH